MNKKMKRRLKRIVFGGLLFVLANIVSYIFEQGLNISYQNSIILVLFLIAYLVTGGDIVRKAVGNIKTGQIFDENFLMSIASIGAFFVGEYPEGVAVMLFYQVGELFQSYAVNKSRDSISSLMDIYPDYANVKRDGKVIQVEPDEVVIGETILIKPGERVPLDGRVISGSTTLDTRALTGESLPREIAVGEDVISGCININGVIEVEVTKEFGESTIAKILNLVENASSKKAPSENFITKFSRYYTPLVVGFAALLAVIPPLFIEGAIWSDWIYRALTFLVISCPCALVISVPLSFFGGLGGASRNGILVKGGNYLETLSKAEIVVFDKTGTLTKGIFKVKEILPVGIEKETLLEFAAYAEIYSNHPISLSLKDAYAKELEHENVSGVEELSGYGVKAVYNAKEVLVGNDKLMRLHGLSPYDEEKPGTLVHVAIDGEYRGYILIADEIKEDAKETIHSLNKINVTNIVMLTGDRKTVGDAVAKEIGISRVFSELLPDDKVTKMEELMKEKSSGGKLVFVGDGINDAPVLAGADIGIAMGGLGSDAAIEAADIVIMTDEPSKIAKGIRISKKTLRIVKQNIVFALGVKLLVLILAALGYASMWAAVFADVGVSVIAILNAMRALYIKVNKN